MADVIDLQEAWDNTPQEEKASNYSLALCHKSYKSWVACWVK
ncbi:hypothetical protein [Propioniciclava soli]|uniref:Uncharacterized protein n=1 Tax=Propioniciclava soli TaxID=2775081 RepID=A0ABZ3C809_9ACTN|nr:hypothetical protein [Propioniciclava soli]